MGRQEGGGRGGLTGGREAGKGGAVGTEAINQREILHLITPAIISLKVRVSYYHSLELAESFEFFHNSRLIGSKSLHFRKKASIRDFMYFG